MPTFPLPNVRYANLPDVEGPFTEREWCTVQDAFGNVHLEYPNVTIEMVERLVRARRTLVDADAA